MPKLWFGLNAITSKEEGFSDLLKITILPNLTLYVQHIKS